MRRKLPWFVLFFVFISFMWSYGANYMPPVKVHKLSNGLTLIVVEKKDRPTVFCYRYHNVGAINEWPGATGSAHLLEHMMFKGTKKIGTWNYKAEVPIMKKIDKLVDEIYKEMEKGLTAYHKVNKKKIARLWKQVKNLQNQQRKYVRRNEIDYIYTLEGGWMANASTGYDRTDYVVFLPANRIEVWAFIESERMKDPVFREFYSERDVVMEEMRMGENLPWDVMMDALFNNMFLTMPYGHPIIGWESDLVMMRRKNIEDFFKRFYAPNNTVLVLVGNVDDEYALKLVKKYFGDIPKGEPIPPVHTYDPPQKGERRVSIEFKATPRIMIGYHGPKPGSRDQYALDMLASILSTGRISRFRKNLIEKGIAYKAEAYNWTMKHANIFVIEATPQSPHSLDELEKAIYAELDKLKKSPPTKWEMGKVKNHFKKQFVKLLMSDYRLANVLALYQATTGDWRNFDERAKYESITADDILKVAKKYLTKKNRTVILLYPPKDGEKHAK